MTLASRHHQKIHRMLAAGLTPSEAPPNSAAVAEVVVDTWSRAAVVLASVIGAEGVGALYARCVALARRTHIWLPTPEFGASHASALVDLGNALRGQLADKGLEAGSELLVTMTHLLGAMIGEALTSRLLESAWGREVPDQRKTGEIPDG